MYTAVKEYIKMLEDKYLFRCLPSGVKKEAHDLYKSNLNGLKLDSKGEALTINGQPFIDSFERIVVGDYGAYVEFSEENFNIKNDVKNRLIIPNRQRYRVDEKFISEKNLHIKYIHFEFLRKKIYFQKDTVKYADYKPNMFYISVLDVDKVE